MEAHSETHAAGSPIGVIDPSGTIAPALTELGFTVIGGTEFRTAATAISDRARDGHGVFPIVVVDHDAHGIDVWTEAISELTIVAVLTHGQGPLAHRTDVLRFPLSVNTLLARIGLAHVDTPIGARILDGHSTAPQLPEIPAPAPAGANPYRQPRSRADIARDSGLQLDAAMPASAATPEPTATPPAPAPEPARITSTHTASDFDDDARYFSERASRHGQSLQPHLRRAHHELAPVAFVISGKGGVGKSGTALQLGNEAAAISREAGSPLRVTVIDGNRGQGDLRGYLWIPDDAVLPTIYDAIAKGPEAALVTPNQYGPYRQKHQLAVPDFAIVLTPPPQFATPTHTPASVYLDVITYAREVSDLVIVDTQVLEAQKTDLWLHAFLPILLGPGAWLLALANETAPALNNLRNRLTELVGDHGMSKAHTLLMATMFSEFADEDHLRFAHKLGSLGQVVGATANDPEIREAFNTGRIDTRFEATAPALRIVLNHVTGRHDLFDPIPEPERPSFLELLRKKPRSKLSA